VDKYAVNSNFLANLEKEDPRYYTQGLDVWAISNYVGYQFEYISDQGSAFSKNIPEIRKLLDSVEFTPIVEEEPKLPSFMQ
jgi:hypothetical protein